MPSSRAPPKSQIKSVLYGNRAACHLALEDHKKVIEDADKAIEVCFLGFFFFFFPDSKMVLSYFID